jgi:hypothetical protein
MTWTDIDKKKSCGFISPSAICKAAKERLLALKYDDQADQLYKLRISTKCRVYGFRNRNIFHVLWWDPEHSVYPMDVAENRN